MHRACTGTVCWCKLMMCMKCVQKLRLVIIVLFVKKQVLLWILKQRQQLLARGLRVGLESGKPRRQAGCIRRLSLTAPANRCASPHLRFHFCCRCHDCRSPSVHVGYPRDAGVGDWGGWRTPHRTLQCAVTDRINAPCQHLALIGEFKLQDTWPCFVPTIVF